MSDDGGVCSVGDVDGLAVSSMYLFVSSKGTFSLDQACFCLGVVTPSIHSQGQ